MATAMLILSAAGVFSLREEKDERIHHPGRFPGRWQRQHDHIKKDSSSCWCRAGLVGIPHPSPPPSYFPTQSLKASMARPSAYACFRFGGRRYPCGTRTHWTNTPSESASSGSASAVLAEAPDCSTMMGSRGAWRVSLPLALAFFSLGLVLALVRQHISHIFWFVAMGVAGRFGGIGGVRAGFRAGGAQQSLGTNALG